MMASAMIEGRFHVTRGTFELDAELSVPALGVTALFGESGSGKTTLLRAVAGLEQNPGGHLRVGESVWQDGQHFVPIHQRALGYVFQESSLFTHLSVRGNLEFSLKRAQHVNPEGRAPDFSTAIELLGIGHLLARRVEKLSGGERQRVAIARALLRNPQLLLMDEPLTGLDIRARNEILPFIERLHAELSIPVLYVSHAPDEVARLADCLVLLDRGRIIATGPIDEMLTRLDLPLAHGDRAEALIEAVVAAHDDEFGLTLLDFPAGQFCVPKKDLRIGESVRLRILARDVSLTLERQTDTSILNIFPATVEAISEENESQNLIRLDAQGVPILSQVTRKSTATLDLTPGKSVYAQAKSIALLA